MAVGLPLKTTYANGDVYSASDVNDTNGTINTFVSAGPIAGKNCLINGGFDIWQRGTSAATAGGSYVSADRWWVYTASGSATFGQETTTIPANSQYAAKITSTGAGTSIFVAQAVETENVLFYAGKNLTFSGQVAASASVPLTVQVQWSATVDNAVNGSWTTITPTSGGTVTPTSTTYVPFTAVFAIPSTAKSLRIGIYHTGTVANGVVTYLGNFQAEVGSSATTFSRAGGTIQGELAACQRYYVRYDGTDDVISNGAIWSTTLAFSVLQYPVEMRVAPTLSASATNAVLIFANGGSATSSANAFAEVGTKTARWQITSSGLTSGYACWLQFNSSGKFLEISAEL